MHHPAWLNGRPGHVAAGLPWDHQPYRDRLHTLEKEQKALEKSSPTYPNEKESAKMRQQLTVIENIQVWQNLLDYVGVFYACDKFNLTITTTDYEVTRTDGSSDPD